MSMVEEASDLSPSAPLSRAPLILRRLTWLYLVYLAFVGLMMVFGVAPIAGIPKLKGMAVELAAGGMGAVALSTVILALAILLAAALVANERLARRRAEALRMAGELESGPQSPFALLWRLGPGFLAREGQAALIVVEAIVLALIAWRLWPSAMPPQITSEISNNATLMAAVIIGLAFPSLIAERIMAGFPAEQMPEAPGIRRVLLIVTVVLAATGVAEIGRAIGFAWVFWAQRALLAVVLVVAAEFTLRALGRLFLPPPPAESAKGVSESIVASLITGGARAPGQLMRTHLGLDFSRSWALQFISKAMGPAVVGTLLFCWILSGVKLMGNDQRGVYERFGAPVKVVGPGFHLLAPWPFGRLRPVEYGTTHIIAVGAKDGLDAEAKERAAEKKVGVEDIPDVSMNRLWETAHATEAEYLVASDSGGAQSFQEVNGEILVVYRTGMTDQAAMEAVYGSADQATVVLREANRLATRYFASHTLDQVIGGQRDQLQVELRRQLQKAVDADKAGVDVVAVLIDAIHPPVGAAAAYQAVQAAQITAEASVFQATARATRVAGEAQQEAHQATASAEALAVEKVQAAQGDAYQFDADRQAYRAAPPAFLLERKARNLSPALKGVRLTILDHRLSPAQAPIIDLREAGMAPAMAAAAAAPAGAKPAYAPEPTPGTSTEGPAPPSTSEDAQEQATAKARGARGAPSVTEE